MKRAAVASNGQRRQRPKSQSVGDRPDFPEIPGVPPDLTPLLVESLSSATRFFQHAPSTPLNPFRDDEESDRSTSTSQQQNSSVIDSILNRMSSSEEEKTRRKRRERMEEDCQSWLNALKRQATNDGKSVPVSCFRYLWEIGQENSRLTARRASLHLCGALLQKSSECRMYVATDDILFTWVTCVVGAQNLKAAAEQPVSCWQAEALIWLSHLTEEYGDLYPKFRVARQFLKQRCSSSLHTFETNNAMPDMRRLRDIAMKYGDREIEKVEKLIQRAHDCLDVLVPRMGDNAGSKTAVAVAALSSIAEEDEHDDDDIEWEDGDGEMSEDTTGDHATAVERTLEAMASAGGFRGGAMEINLARNENCEDYTDVVDENARKVLQKTVRSIKSQHMKRLSFWVDALIKADGLVLNGKSLVVMSVDESRKQGELLHRLLDKKRTLASILASATRLGIYLDAGDTNTPAPRPPTAVSNLPPQRQRAVLAAVAKRRSDSKVAGRRSTKLQIKYRKS